MDTLMQTVRQVIKQPPPTNQDKNKVNTVFKIIFIIFIIIVTTQPVIPQFALMLMPTGLTSRSGNHRPVNIMPLWNEEDDKVAQAFIKQDFFLHLNRVELGLDPGFFFLQFFFAIFDLQKRTPLEVSMLQLFYAYMQHASSSQLMDTWPSLLALLREGLQLNLPPPGQFLMLV